MQEGKIIDYLGENKYVILLPDEEEYNESPTPMVVRFAHDYVEFEDSAPFEMLAKNGEDQELQFKFQLKQCMMLSYQCY